MKFSTVFIVAMCIFLKAEAEESYLYFTSQTDVAEKFIERVSQEKHSIRVVSHRLSQLDVIQSLIEAHRRNVLVEVVVDSVSVTKKTPLSLLLKEGIAVFVWNSESFPKKKSEAPKRMHHGFCVFGEDLSWTGSYSFSLKSRFHHFESALLVRDLKVAKGFLGEFDEIKKKHAIAFPLYLEQKGISL